jgi:Sporulation protein and related proteins
VNDTVDQVVKYGSRVVCTYFYSQSGGHTANVEDVWVPEDGDLAAKAAVYPELRGVPDPYEHLASPPYSPWPPGQEKTYTGLELSAKLQGISGVPTASVFVTGISVEHVASGHARYVTFTFANGAQVRVTGDTVRSRLGLRSTRFYLTGFPMERIYGNTRYDTAVRVSASAFPSTAPAVVLASGEDYADALTGSALPEPPMARCCSRRPVRFPMPRATSS